MTFLNTFFANLEHLTYLALLELFLPGPCNCTCEQHLEAPTSGNGWLEGQLVAPGRFQIHTETYLSSTLVTFPWRKIWFHICRLTLCSWPEKDSNFEWVLKSYSSMVSMRRTNLENPLLTVVPNVTTPCLTPASAPGARKGRSNQRTGNQSILTLQPVGMKQTCVFWLVPVNWVP